MDEKTNKPRVSILIPVYNREDFIGECIDSALDQSFSDIEIIVVDNASTDKTWDVCQGYVLRDPRVRIFRNETNIGPVRNWQRCIREARGEYGKILFSDDLIAPDYIARTLPLLLDTTVAFVYTAAYIGESFGKGRIEYKSDTSRYGIQEYYERLVTQLVPVSPGAAIFRTSDMKKNLHDTFPTCSTHQFWRHGAGPDVMLYALTAMDYTTVAAISEPLVLFRAHAGSLSIANINNEVIDGYRAALSWFFKKHVSDSLWLNYVVWQWVSELKTSRTWIDIGSYIKKYEGNVTLSVLIKFWHKAFICTWLRLWRKYIKT